MATTDHNISKKFDATLGEHSVVRSSPEPDTTLPRLAFNLFIFGCCLYVAVEIGNYLFAFAHRLGQALKVIQ